MIKKTLHPKWSDKHKEYIRSGIHSTISVAEGAVRAGKTVDNVAIFAKMLEMGVPDRIHLASGSTSANAKLNIGECNGMGLEYIFRGRCKWSKFKGNECLRIKTTNKEYIVIFVGGSKADSFKKIRGNSYGMWIATEINLHHDSFIKEAFNRQLASKVRRVIWDLNPSSPANFIYTDYIDRFEKAYGEKYNYQHFTIRDNLTISEKRIAEIEAQYTIGSIWYQRDILGLRCNANGLIYDNFNSEAHVLNELPELEHDFYISCDFGIRNANVFLFWQREKQIFDENEKPTKIPKWICTKEIYYSGRENQLNKTVTQLVNDLMEELGKERPEQIIVDPSATALIEELRQRDLTVIKADNDVFKGITDVRTLLGLNYIAFNKTCEKTIKEFGIYAWDEKASQNGEDKPIKVSDHCMDAIRYFVRTKHIVRRMKGGE